MFKCHICDTNCKDNDKGGLFGIGPTCFRALKIALLLLKDGEDVADRLKLAGDFKNFRDSKKFYKNLRASTKESVDEFYSRITQSTENYEEAKNYIKDNKEIAILLVELKELNERLESPKKADTNEYYKVKGFIKRNINLINKHLKDNRTENSMEKVSKINKDFNIYFDKI